ncbi:RNase H domain-containing protein [Trichonephila clavipes]|nr:RNase H domain-containing protein [Trichonephila clavipes]
MALGLPQWTPNIVLLKLAGQEILSDKIRRLANKFLITQISNSDFSPLYYNSPEAMNLNVLEEDKNYIISVLQDLNIGGDQIISIPRYITFLDLPCKIYTNRFKFQDKNLPIPAISVLFDETVEREFQKFFIIATDASKNDQITSIAETLAICHALDDLVESNVNLLVLSDSLSVLSALQNFLIKSNKFNAERERFIVDCCGVQNGSENKHLEKNKKLGKYQQKKPTKCEKKFIKRKPSHQRVFINGLSVSAKGKSAWKRPSESRQKTTRTPENIERVKQLVENDHRLTMRMIAEELGSVRVILTEDLGNSYRIATPKQMEIWPGDCRDLIDMVDRDKNFLNIVTGDESWCVKYDPESKQQSLEWQSPSLPRKNQGTVGKITH